jgi:hypothetical protein
LFKAAAIKFFLNPKINKAAKAIKIKKALPIAIKTFHNHI